MKNASKHDFKQAMNALLLEPSLLEVMLKALRELLLGGASHNLPQRPLPQNGRFATLDDVIRAGITSAPPHGLGLS